MADEINLPTMEVRPDSANFVDKPKINLSDIRKQFPMYSDLNDDQLLIGLHKKFYSDMPVGQFTARINYDTNKPNPASDSYFENALAGAGKAVSDTGLGIKQLFGKATKGEAEDAAARDAPLMNAPGGTLGNIGGQVGMMYVPGGVAGKIAPAVNALGKAAPYVAAGLTAGTFGGLQPVTGDDSRTGNALTSAVGGLVGQGVASGVSRLAKGASDAIAPATKALYDKAQAMGIPVSAAQLGDSKFVKYLQDALSKLPLSGAKGAQEEQQGAFNRAVSRTFGEDSPTVDSSLYAQAKKRIGGVFNDLSGRNTLNATPALASDLGDVSNSARLATSDTQKSVAAAIDEIMSKADPKTGDIPGKAYQSFDSWLTGQIKTGGESSVYLGQVRNAVRDAMDASISPADQAAWKTARKEYANLKTIRDLVAKDDGGGNISPNALMGRVTATGSGKERMAMGNGGELGDLAQVGKKFFYNPPDSGTALRNLIYGGAAGGAGYGAYGMSGDHDATHPGYYLAGAAGLLGAAVAGRAGGSLLRSPAMGNYFANGAGPVGNALAIPAKVAPVLLPGYLNIRQK